MLAATARTPMQNGRRLAPPVFRPSHVCDGSWTKKLFLRGSLLAGALFRGGTLLRPPALGRLLRGTLFRGGTLLRRLALHRLLRSPLLRGGALLRRLLGGPLL